MSLHSIRHLEIVQTLAQHRHFGRAAAALGVSQPSLTRSLKHLEDILGVPLFDRGDGVTPTVFGRIVLERGETLLLGFAELAREITLAKGLEIGELTIALGPYPAEISGQKAAGLLTACYPGLAIQLATTDWIHVVEDVLHGRADLGFADISEASAHPDLETELVRTSNNFSAAKEIVFASDTLAVTLPALIDPELKEGVCVLPVELPWMRLNYGFVARRGRTPSPAVKAFKEFARTIENDIPS